MKTSRQTVINIIIILIIFPFYHIHAIENVKNIIFYIGDGMGINQVLAARISLQGVDGRFHFEKMPITGLVSTHSIDRLITDSAASATAMATGFKTRNGMVGVSPDSLPLQTIMEAAISRKIATGLIATSSITHATPACFATHVVSRSEHNEIARQLVMSGVDILMGGGRGYFLPQGVQGSKREDNVDLLALAAEEGYEFVSNTDQLNNSHSSRILGLFALKAMSGQSEEPNLAVMTQRAIDILSRNENSFFLVVEGSQIDWAGHDNNLNGIVREMRAFDEAVNIGLNFAEQNSNTLIVVTADHETGGLILTGGQKDGSDLSVKWATKGHTVQFVPVYASGPGATLFSGVNDNTFFAKNFAELLGIADFD